MDNKNLFGVDDIKVEMPNKTLSENIAKISVIGVGGGGCNMINHMINEGTHKIDLIAANTDLQVLRISKAPKKIQLGLKLTKGLGAGMKPEVGRDSAVESYEDIKESLNGADIVFIAAGLGGGTGTGAAAIIAKAAKDIGALTVSVVTKPFTWEGKKRAGLANLGLEEIKKVSDSIIVVPNDRLLEIIDENVGMKDAFKIIDNILYQAVNGMSEVILNPGNSDINTDFADVKTIMQHRGMALMGIGRAKGEEAAQRALEDAIDSPLLDKVSLNGAKGILIHFNIHPQVSLFAINSVMGTINDRMDSNAEIIFGTTSDSTLEKDEVKITIVATGFESKNEEFEQEGEENEEKASVRVNDENHLDVPPLMRDYVVQYHIVQTQQHVSPKIEE
jgi:cell division protein FtsZ